MIRVMCTGRIDLAHILRAFLKGADAVFVGGCHLNECNYTTHGNFHAESMVHLGKRLLEYAGVDPARLRIELISSGEGNKFADTMNDFSAAMRELGPLGLGEEGGGIRAKLERLIALVPYFKLALKEKLKARLDEEEDYKSLYSLEEVSLAIDEVISYYIDPADCQACTSCAKRCPVEAISGGRNLVHVIDQAKCIHCGACHEACPPRFGAVKKIVSAPVPPPPTEEQRTIDRRNK